MTEKEAVGRISEHMKAHHLKEGCRCLYITKALSMAIDALEKQTPKKVYKDEDGFPFCPICKNLSVRDGVTGEKYAHCYECGQAIDWSEDA